MQRAQRWMLAGLVAGLGGFCIVALDEVAHGPLYQTDSVVNNAVGTWQANGGPANTLGGYLTLIGDWRTETAVVVAAAAWMFVKKERQLAAWCVGIALAASLTSTLLKMAFARPRPPLGHLVSYSFPSGHTFGTAAVIGSAMILSAETFIRDRAKSKRATLHVWEFVLPAWALLTALTAIGRVLMQDHWMSDTLASGLLGLALISGLFFGLSRKAPAGEPGPQVPEKPAKPAKRRKHPAKQ